MKMEPQRENLEISSQLSAVSFQQSAFRVELSARYRESCTLVADCFVGAFAFGY